MHLIVRQMYHKGDIKRYQQNKTGWRAQGWQAKRKVELAWGPLEAVTVDCGWCDAV